MKAELGDSPSAGDPIRGQLALLAASESKRYSQNGEDGILDTLARLTGCPETMIELGAGTGVENNARHRREQGWQVVAVDAAPGEESWVNQAFLTAENVNDVLDSLGAPPHPGILSVDLDGNDFWVLRALDRKFLPSILVAEYNASLGSSDPLVMPYSPEHVWDMTNFYGASLSALDLLASELGLDLVYCETQGVNAFFVRRDLREAAGLVRTSVAEAYQAPKFGWLDARGNPRGHAPTTRRFVRVETMKEVHSASAGAPPELEPLETRWERAGVLHQSIAEAERYALSLKEHYDRALQHARSLEDRVDTLQRARVEAERYAHRLEARLEAGLAAGNAPPPGLEDTPTTLCFCTIVARNYLAYARVLAGSIRRHHPGAEIFVLLIDDEHEACGEGEEDFRYVRPSGIGISLRDFHDMAAMYEVTELATALKPWLLRTLLRGRRSVVYLDPDIQLFGSMAEVAALAEANDIVLTPHTLSPIRRDGLEPSEPYLLRAGIYNLGFIAVGPGSGPFLDWWEERLSRDCVVRPEEELFVDQRWIDFLPGYFRHHVLREAGYNVAYWNADQRGLNAVGAGYEVNGEPLRFLHFSGFQPETPDVLTRYVLTPRFRLDENAEMARLARSYANRLVAAGHLDCARLPAGFTHSAGGVLLDPNVRNAYRTALLAHDRGEAPRPPDPFDGHRHHSFVGWLKEPAYPNEPAISRYARGLYDRRADLKLGYPNLAGNAGERFLASVRAHEGLPEEFAAAQARSSAPADLGIQLPSIPPGSLLEGVNVAGYFFAESGIGEVARLLVATLAEAGIPYSVVPFERASNRQEAYFPDRGSGAPIFDTNIFCINADQLPNFLSSGGEVLRQNRRNIGLWAWEVEQFPDRFRPSAELLDEIWVFSEHARRAVSSAVRTPVRVFPLPVDHDDRWVPHDCPQLPEGFVFAFCFDYLSVFERKNPIAVVKAFCRAFEPGEGASLLLKSVNGHLDPDHLMALRMVAEHSDIHMFDGYLDQGAQRALIRGCDAYISLHRAEGFGLSLAEAMAMGKPIIGTAYSGNLEFMNAENSYLVPFDLVPIPAGCDPYPEGAMWAEPDIDAAAASMREVFVDREGSGARGRAAAGYIRAHHSPEARAPRLKLMLEGDRALAHAPIVARP